MYGNLNSTKSTERNKIQVNLIKRALTNLKNRTKNMSENEKRIEQPNKIVNIVEKILGFSERYQQVQELKILTPNQRYGRLPITLVQLKVVNNSEKT